MSFAAPGGFKLRRAPAWLILVLGIVAIVVGGLAYVATHRIPISVPLTAVPVHS